MEDSFLLFMLVGFLAQIVDGALGMAYGVVSSTVMLSFGVAPAVASATVHAAEVFTTGASAASHIAHRNVDWRLFRRLAPAGIVGGLIGTYILTSFDGSVLKPWIVGYLGIMGVYILYRSNHEPDPYHEHSTGGVVALGGSGGFVDAVGGGGWGPVVTTGLIGAGGAPRKVIGTVNATEFFLTLAVSAGFLIALVTGHWDEEKALMDHATAVGGLIVGGVIAAPLAGYVTRILPHRVAMVLVGLLICTLAAYQLARLL